MRKKVGIVSMNYDQWEIGQIIEAVRSNSYDVDLMDPRKEVLTLDKIYNEGSKYQSVLGRVERPILQSGLMLLKELELNGERMVNNFQAIQYGQNKCYTSMLLAKKKIRHPKTICSYTNQVAEILSQIKEFTYPIVFKPISGGRGEGVSRACCLEEAIELITVLTNCSVPFYIQEFIRNKQQKGYFDYRIFVVGEEAIGGIRRQAFGENWKTNICNGGVAQEIKLNDELTQLAVASAKAIGADIAGIDVIEGDEGYFVLEVNVCPLFHGLYEATGINPAVNIASLLCA
ncbi:ATP-grasp domain-containing protein [Anaerovorax sp. IOR16]|uniref:ATP-grasp domain-containing protein n=1 Tax=Anaerovorax sp. IOR16 TaxID=2773458 RepID=UPI0019CF504B|nr:RimK family alpha-L-glutamate ligase [Anaerovorax sp. IOR16]